MLGTAFKLIYADKVSGKHPNKIAYEYRYNISTIYNTVTKNKTSAAFTHKHV